MAITSTRYVLKILAPFYAFLLHKAGTFQKLTQQKHKKVATLQGVNDTCKFNSCRYWDSPFPMVQQEDCEKQCGIHLWQQKRINRTWRCTVKYAKKWQFCLWSLSTSYHSINLTFRGITGSRYLNFMWTAVSLSRLLSWFLPKCFTFFNLVVRQKHSPYAVVHLLPMGKCHNSMTNLCTRHIASQVLGKLPALSMPAKVNGCIQEPTLMNLQHFSQ